MRARARGEKLGRLREQAENGAPAQQGRRIVFPIYFQEIFK
jgi:hypothetical protein